nr:MAG TPA: hypothetical protein [Caudoviricetes sp.]
MCGGMARCHIERQGNGMDKRRKASRGNGLAWRKKA